MAVWEWLLMTVGGFFESKDCFVVFLRHVTPCQVRFGGRRVAELSILTLNVTQWQSCFLLYQSCTNRAMSLGLKAICHHRKRSSVVIHQHVYLLASRVMSDVWNTRLVFRALNQCKVWTGSKGCVWLQLRKVWNLILLVRSAVARVRD